MLSEGLRALASRGANLIRGSRRVSPFLLVALFVSGACGSRPRQLENAQPSATELARAVLDAVATRNTDVLRRLALNEAEFRGHVWPQLPAARPERNLPFSYVWGDLYQKSEQALTRTLTAYGGRRFELVEVKFSSVSDYVVYRMHREAAFVVRSGDGGQSAIRLCGSLLEKDGKWKVFSYVNDD